MYNRSVARRVMKSDPDAFRILYDDWAGEVYAMAYDMLGDTALAKNAAAECFFRAWKQTDGLTDDRQLSQWLIAIVKKTCSEAAFARRELSETDKEEVWEKAAARARINTREWETTGNGSLLGEQSGECAAEDDWKPLIFLPDEEEHPAAAEIKEPGAAEESKPEKTQTRKKKGREDSPKRSDKARLVLTGSLAVIAIVLVGGAVLLGLAGAGIISLPESLSGAANAIKTWLSAFAG